MVWEWRGFEHFEEKDEWGNEIISDEAVILKWKLLDFDINFGIWLFNFYIRQQEDEEEEDEGEEEEKEEEVRDRNNTDGN